MRYIYKLTNKKNNKEYQVFSYSNDVKKLWSELKRFSKKDSPVDYLKDVYEGHDIDFELKYYKTYQEYLKEKADLEKEILKKHRDKTKNDS